MSRRSQSRRRRTYGRRQHEVRERRPDTRPGETWLGDNGSEFEAEWQAADSIDDRATYGESFGGYSR
jgi:hypothetical protein